MIVRVSLGALAVSSAATGLPAAIAPRAFYDGWPLWREWVAMLPPFDQHLVTDVGGFYVAFAVLFAWAAVTLRRELIVPLCTAWVVAALLPFGYHVTHLDGWEVAERGHTDRRVGAPARVAGQRHGVRAAACGPIGWGFSMKDVAMASMRAVAERVSSSRRPGLRGRGGAPVRGRADCRLLPSRKRQLTGR
jgi:hypothetical protein